MTPLVVNVDRKMPTYATFSWIARRKLIRFALVCHFLQFVMMGLGLMQNARTQHLRPHGDGIAFILLIFGVVVLAMAVAVLVFFPGWGIAVGIGGLVLAVGLIILAGQVILVRRSFEARFEHELIVATELGVKKDDAKTWVELVDKNYRDYINRQHEIESDLKASLADRAWISYVYSRKLDGGETILKYYKKEFDLLQIARKVDGKLSHLDEATAAVQIEIAVREIRELGEAKIDIATLATRILGEAEIDIARRERYAEHDERMKSRRQRG